jgi:hypothetical protein
MISSGPVAEVKHSCIPCLCYIILPHWSGPAFAHRGFPVNSFVDLEIVELRQDIPRFSVYRTSDVVQSADILLKYSMV